MSAATTRTTKSNLSNMSSLSPVFDVKKFSDQRIWFVISALGWWTRAGWTNSDNFRTTIETTRDVTSSTAVSTVVRLDVEKSSSWWFRTRGTAWLTFHPLQFEDAQNHPGVLAKFELQLAKWGFPYPAFLIDIPKDEKTGKYFMYIQHVEYDCDGKYSWILWTDGTAKPKFAQVMSRLAVIDKTTREKLNAKLKTYNITASTELEYHV